MATTTAIPQTHAAAAVTALRTPYSLITRPTQPPLPGQVLVRVRWAAAAAGDLHVIDGGVASPSFPFVTGTCLAGTVVQAGGRPRPADASDPPHATADLQPGDDVFGFAFGKPERKTHQEYVTLPTYHLGRLPAGMSMRDAVTVPANLITAFHTLTKDLGLDLPWPVRASDAAGKKVPIVLWGAASGVGQYTVQVLRHYGYESVIAVASARHHGYLRELGAAACFDYREEGAVEKVLSYAAGVSGAGGDGPRVPYIVDCIGSREGTLRLLTRVAERGTRVAVMLPVVTKEGTAEAAPEYEMDIGKVLVGQWADGVEVRGVRTYFYQENEFFKYHLMPEIVPEVLAKGFVKPNRARVVEGETLVERVQKAMDLLRDKAQGGEKIIFRVAEE